VNTITMPDGETFVRRSEADRRAGQRLHLAMVSPADDRFVGEIVLFCRAAQAAEEAIGEIAYVVDPAARGRGIASSAVRLLSEWAFARLALARLQLAIHPDNVPSRRVAEKAGYVPEGTLRSLKMIRGERVDSVLYSRLPGDPPPDAG
jgi:RimJ/RimL family protein N-acetyltransferase